MRGLAHKPSRPRAAPNQRVFREDVWKTCAKTCVSRRLRGRRDSRRKEVYQVRFFASSVFHKTTARSGRLGQLAHVFPENTWRVLPLELSWQHARQRSAPCARAPLGRLRCDSTEHSEGVPLLPRAVLSGRRPRRGAWHINFACGGRGSPRRRQALPAARGSCVAPRRPQMRRARLEAASRAGGLERAQHHLHSGARFRSSDLSVMSPTR